MIKLEQLVDGSQVRAEVTISTVGANGVTVSAEAGARSRTQDGQWVEDGSKASQTVSFIGDRGPVQLKCVVHETSAVDAGACSSVTMEVAIKSELAATFEAGQKSRQMAALTLVRVVAVERDGKPLWRAEEPRVRARTSTPLTEPIPGGLTGAGKSSK